MAMISKFQNLWKRSNITFKIGFIILFIHILIAITGPFWAPYHYAAINVGEPLTGMSWKYPFGVDALGRDIFSRVIHGSWMVISLSILGTSIGLLVGAFTGLFSAYAGGWIDETIQRINEGFISIPFLILGLFKWLTIFGFASVSAFILFYEIKIKKNIFIVFLLSSIEGLITYSGFLSRAMIFNQISLILGIKKLFFLNKEELKLQKIIILTIFSLFSFFISIYIVNTERETIYSQAYIDKNATNFQNNHEKFYDERQVFEIQKELKKENNELKIKKNKLLLKEKKLFSNAPIIHSFWYLFANRWIGINSVLSVVSHPMLNIEITKNSLKEKFDSQNYSFYEREFLGLTKHYNINYSSDLYGIILPGFVAFSFYSGSYILLIIFMLMFYSFCSVIEIIAYKFSDQNIIFAALIGQVVAYRLIHFGYLPSQSYLLILSILLNVLIYFLVVNFFSSKK